MRALSIPDLNQLERYNLMICDLSGLRPNNISLYTKQYSEKSEVGNVGAFSKYILLQSWYYLMPLPGK
jgi:hypothetical protein